MDWFQFHTRIQPSVIDGNDCIVRLRAAQQSWFIRKIHDELRRGLPGMFLGPAMWKKGANRAANVLWFALDATAK